jgi:hypothetical protein
MSESPYEYEDISAGIEPELWDSACQHVLCMAPRLLIAYRHYHLKTIRRAAS